MALPEGVEYHTGDHIGVLPRNSAALVQRVAARFGLTPQTRIRIRNNANQRSHLPLELNRKEWVQKGALFSYGPDFQLIGREGARYVDSILRGAKPAELPVLQPTKFELVINLKTAKALGLTLPSGLLSIADEVIE